jgi:hypothetical protein
MTEAEAESFVAEVGDVTAALRRGEIGRANELLLACRMFERISAGPLPPDPIGERVRAVVADALALALEMQSVQRVAITQGGSSRRAIGAYGQRSRR